ncbi:MAG: diguanylate cyclase, partial [Clostridia bacterium]
AFFAVGYFGIIYRHDIFNINLVISSDDILKTSNNAIFVIDENNEILKYNVAAGNLLSYNKSELIGKDFIGMMLNPINFAQDYSPDNLINFESKMRCKDQNIKDVLISASAAKDKRNNFLCMIVSCQDVTRQKVIQRELELQEDKYKKLAADYKQLANYDSLTGLPNRRCFFEALNAFEEGYKTEKKDFAVLFLDLDNFKRVNDLYGHKVGDDLLIATTYKLKTCIDNDEILARLGGDEFMIVMPYTNSDCVECKLQKIHEEFLKCISLNGQSYQIKLSVGSAVFSQMEDITMLMQIADEAMYENKQKKSRD